MGRTTIFFFKNTGKQQFVKYFSPDNPIGRDRVLEFLPCEGPLLEGGFLWYHVKNLLRSDYDNSVKMMSARPDLFIPLSELEDTPFKNFEIRYHPVVPFAHMRNIYRVLFDASKPFIEKEFEDLIMTVFKKTDHDMKINTENYISEFAEEIELIVHRYIARYRHLLLFGGADMGEAVRTLLKRHFQREADHYVRCRLMGRPIKESLERITRCLELFKDKSFVALTGDSQITQGKIHPWEKALCEYDGAFLIHIHDESMIDRIRSLNLPKDIDVILLCDMEIPDETELPDNFASLTLEWSRDKAYENQFLEVNFPYIYHCANAMEWIIRLLHPSFVKSLADNSVSGRIITSLALKYGLDNE